MMAFDAVLKEVSGLDARELEHWVEARWVLPERGAEGYLFHEIDVARVHLIVELRRDLMIDEDAIPVILGLLDQVYALRSRLKSLADAIKVLPPEIQTELRAHFEE